MKKEKKMLLLSLFFYVNYNILPTFCFYPFLDMKCVLLFCLDMTRKINVA